MKISKMFISAVIVLTILACSTIRNNDSNDVSSGETGETNLPNAIERSPLSFYTSILEGELQTGLTAISLPGSTLRTSIVYRAELENQRSLGRDFRDQVAITPPSSYDDTVEDLIITTVGSDTIYSIKSVTTRRGTTPNNQSKTTWDNDIIFRQYGDFSVSTANVPLFDERGNIYRVPARFRVLSFEYRNGFNIEANQNGTSTLATVPSRDFVNRSFVILISSNENGLQVITTRESRNDVGPITVVSDVVRTYRPIVPSVEVGAFPLERTALSTLTSVLSGEVQTQVLTRPLRMGVTRGTAIYRREVSPNGLTSAFQQTSLVVPQDFYDDIAQQETYTNDLVEELIYTRDSATGDEFLTLRNIITRRGFIDGVFPKKIWSNDTIFLGTRDIYFKNIEPAVETTGILTVDTGVQGPMPEGFRAIDIQQFNVSSRTNLNQSSNLSVFTTPRGTVDSPVTPPNVNFKLIRITEDEIQMYNTTVIRRELGVTVDGLNILFAILPDTQIITYNRVR